MSGHFEIETNLQLIPSEQCLMEKCFHNCELLCSTHTSGLPHFIRIGLDCSSNTCTGKFITYCCINVPYEEIFFTRK